MKTSYLSLVPIAALASACADTDVEIDGSTITDSKRSEIVTNMPSRDNSVSSAYMGLSAYFPNATALDYYWIGDFGYPGIMIMMDVQGEDMNVYSDNNNWFYYERDFSDRAINHAYSQIIWSDLYSYIRNANAILKIYKEAETAQTAYNRAEGLTLRAFSYFNLAQLYQFTYFGNEDAPCVPILTDENSDQVAIDGGAPRSSVRKVYDLIVSDLDEAVSLMTVAEEEGVTRPDKRYANLATIYGLRARVDLVMHKYAQAAADAEAAIEKSGCTPASATDIDHPAFTKVADMDNCLWGIILNSTDDVASYGWATYGSWLSSFMTGYAYYCDGIRVSKKLFESISTTDVRRGWWLDADKVSANLSEEQQWFVSSYVGYPAYTNVKFGVTNPAEGWYPYQVPEANDVDAVLMRVEEMYLIKAEAEAMTGGNGLSTLVDFVKTYRDPDYSFSSSGKDLVNEIWRQRRIEFWGEGLSWFDIMRFKTGIDRRNTDLPQTSNIFKVAHNDNILLWQIPQAEVEANAKLTEADYNPMSPTPQAVPDEVVTIADESVLLD